MDYYSRSLQKNPDYVPSLIAAATLLRELGAYPEAIDYLMRARDLVSNSKEVLLELARTYVMVSDVASAQALIDEGMALFPNDPDYSYLQARIYLMFGRYYLAEKKLTGVLEKNPGHIDSMLALGELFMIQKRFDLAESYFEKARYISPENPDVFISIAMVQFNRIMNERGSNLYSKKLEISEFTEPLEYLSTAIEFDQFYIPANMLLAKMYALAGDCNEAMKLIDTVLVVNRNHPVARYWKGYCEPARHLDTYKDLLRNNQNNEILRYSYERNLIKYSGSRENQRLLEQSKEHYDHGKSLMKSHKNHHGIFEMNWSRFLYPSYIPVHEELFLYYRARKDFYKMGEELNYLRNVSSDKRYQYMYEGWVEKRKEKLYYKEQILHPEEHKTLTPIFVFEFKPNNLFGDYPDAGDAISQSLVFALEQKGRINVLSGTEREEIYRLIRQGDHFARGYKYTPATGKIVLQYLKNKFIKKSHQVSLDYVRYAVEGEYEEISGGLKIEARIVDLETGITKGQFQMSATGRGFLRDIALKLSEYIYTHIPYHGQIIKISSSGVIVNLGSREGISQGESLAVYREGVKITNLKVEIIDNDILWAKPQNVNDIYKIQPGDLIVTEPMASGKIETETQ